MGQKLLADGALQVHQSTAIQAFQVEMTGAFPSTHVLVHVGRLGIAAVLPHHSLAAQLG